MKITRLTLLLLICLFMVEPLTFAKGDALTFQDIDQSYAKEAILYLHEKNIMNGTSAGHFSPRQVMTRAEFATTLVRLLHMEPVTPAVPTYTDVKKQAWYYETIQAASELGLVTGNGNGTFSPAQSITRQEAAALLIRALKEQTGAYGLSGFKDRSSIAEWAQPYVATAAGLGLMEGSDGAFHPKQALTRQEAAMLLYRVLQNEKWQQIIHSKVPASIQLGWQYGQTTEEYERSISKSNINVLSPRWFFLNQDGSMASHVDTSLISWAKQNNKQIWAMVGNRSLQENTHAMLSSKQEATNFIAQLKAAVVNYGLEGINLDFENVAPQDREAMTAFTSELAMQLHSIGAKLSVNVSPDWNTDWTEAFDYASLGSSADYIVLMGYDEHWSGSPIPGSVSSLPWLEHGLDTLLKKVPAAKVILAVPLYNRDWTVNSKNGGVTSEDVTLTEQNTRIQKYGAGLNWKEDLGQYKAVYQANGIAHQLWLEETRSLSQKYKMASERGIAGFAYWHIGGEFPAIWPSLRNMAKYMAQ
ncbi:S-layer homology domain-containing protein [Paenibacillus sp. GM2]|uniref:S-layer homology domain-containing protein n=1 Tax=Paenibacillus sp. GM2 TaxID=1622070 RepID=UPI000839B6DD|nr:S-layer homology domain-containing protein [Paenibacillus sp. GM2]